MYASTVQKTRPTLPAARFLSARSPALLLLDVSPRDGRARMAHDVLVGLSDPVQKSVPPTYFYDREGSQIYEEITELPEYYPTRTEAALLQRILPELCSLLQPEQVVELGSGSSTKTRLLLSAFQAADRPLTYIPVDVSRSMMEVSARGLVRDYPAMRLLGLCGHYEDAISALPPEPDRLVIFLGGTIGNFTPAYQEDFFSRLGQSLLPGSHLLLGFDRRAHAHKPASVIQAAYNDAAGVTARFNLNLLRRLNRELSANFDLSCFAHEARYNERDHQIEMHLRSLRDQQVRIPGAAGGHCYHFAQGETLLTELSRKFDPEELSNWFAAQGFQPVARWTDKAEYFGILLLRRR